MDELRVLAQRAQARDSAAAEELLTRLRPLVYRWAWIQTADRDDAEDVTQAVLLRVHRSLAGFERRASLTTWLFQVTRHASIELQRRRGSWDRLRQRWSQQFSDEVRIDAWPAPTNEEAASHERTIAIIRTIMTRLTQKQRTALDLVDLQGYEPFEAAQMVDMNAATFRTHLLRARRVVRRELLQEEA
ncbi:MAG: RNA polymerase sigma factor [Longimicrobiales bacterium]